MGKFRCDGTLFKMPLLIHLATPKDIIKSKKIRKSLETKRSKCDSSKSNINRDDENLVKRNTWTPLLDDLESARRNQRSHCKADMTLN